MVGCTDLVIHAPCRGACAGAGAGAGAGESKSDDAVGERESKDDGGDGSLLPQAEVDQLLKCAVLAGGAAATPEAALLQGAARGVPGELAGVDPNTAFLVDLIELRGPAAALHAVRPRAGRCVLGVCSVREVRGFGSAAGRSLTGVRVLV